MTSPDYIRGQRDGMDLPGGHYFEPHPDNPRKMQMRSPNGRIWVWDKVEAHAFMTAIRAEAAKLPEADGIDWKVLVDEAETRADELASQCDRLLAQRDAAETALAAMTKRVRVLEEALDIEERYLFEAVENQDDEDGPGIMPSDIEGAFHRIRAGQSASVHAEWSAQRAAAVLTAERGDG